MIRIENIDTYGWESAIRGMRNPLNSWDRSDSKWVSSFENGWTTPFYRIGEKDMMLMKNLISAGSDHSKFMRMITVTMDIIAPLYWWKEFDTYKVGTVANSCSTMHKIHSRELVIEDFSVEHLNGFNKHIFEAYLDSLNQDIKNYIETKDKDYWWQIIQLLPASYNQRRTVQLNYAVLSNIYHARKNHKLDEWKELCKCIETLPYARELIVG